MKLFHTQIKILKPNSQGFVVAVDLHAAFSYIIIYMHPKSSLYIGNLQVRKTNVCRIYTTKQHHILFSSLTTAHKTLSRN